MENVTANATKVSKMFDNSVTMTSNIRTPSGVQALRDPFQALLAVLHFLLCILIMTGNALTLVAVWSTKSLRTIQNKYIVALALVDFSVGFIFAEMLLQYYFKEFQTLKECQFYLAVLYSNFNYSLLIMMSVAVDRYLYIARPFFYVRHVTGIKTRLILIVECVAACICGSSSSFMNGVETCNPFFIFNNKMLLYVLPAIFLAAGIIIGITYGRIACMAKLYRDKKIKRLQLINQVLAKNKPAPQTRENESSKIKHFKDSDIVEPGNNSCHEVSDQRKVSIIEHSERGRDSIETEFMYCSLSLSRRDGGGLGLSKSSTSQSVDKQTVEQSEIKQFDCKKLHGSNVALNRVHVHQATEPLGLHNQQTDKGKEDLKKGLEQSKEIMDSGELLSRCEEYCGHGSVRDNKHGKTESLDHRSLILELKMESLDHRLMLTDQQVESPEQSELISEQNTQTKTALFDQDSLSLDQSTSLDPGPNPWSLTSLRWMKQMVVVFGLFVLSWMPIMIYIHLSIAFTPDFRLAYVLSILSIASSGVNFFVYSYFNKNFRVILKKRLRCQCKD